VKVKRWGEPQEAFDLIRQGMERDGKDGNG
jgi:hypothetical protein